MGISGFACKYLPSKNGYFSTAPSPRLLLQRNCQLYMHAGLAPGQNVPLGGEWNHKLLLLMNPFPRSRWKHAELTLASQPGCFLNVIWKSRPLLSHPPFYPSFRRQPSATKPQCGAWLAACIQQLLCSKFWASHSYPDSHLSYVFCLSCSTASWARRTTNWPAWTGCQHCSTVSLLSPVVCAFPLFATLPALPDPRLVTSSKSSLHSRL